MRSRSRSQSLKLHQNGYLDLEQIATGRSTSLFASDLAQKHTEFLETIRGSSVLILGAAGSIGQIVTKRILDYEPAKLALVDPSENNLVELVRDLRSGDRFRVPEQFETLPIAMGSAPFSRYLSESKPFDYVLNFAALKHVRSEKCIYSMLQMIDTNVVMVWELLNLLSSSKTFFSVSSDKAVNPASVLGASKRAMEIALFASPTHVNVSTTRFANVAFSDGSLLYGILKRLEKGQPVAAPSNVRRYFISHEEAGELSILAAFLGRREIFIPRLHSNQDERTLSDIAMQVLESQGWRPFLCKSEDEARSKLPVLKACGQWPCYFSPAETAGEKEFEEFNSSVEIIDWHRFQNVGVIEERLVDEARSRWIRFCEFAQKIRRSTSVGKDECLTELVLLVEGFHHRSSSLSLDQKM